ncbi:hypothetical protein GCM10009564_35770 [Streptomyces thermogriseus]|uniref:HAMP domain-containing protein n=1 Tax=Streptomyces thermogriseus TaxID=75292 RepID=A0ABN1T1H3_9ACTN
MPGVAGTWKDLTDSVNTVFRNLTTQVRDIAAVTTAVANGDLSQKVTVDVAGEMLELKNTVNTMVDQLSAFSSEVTSWAARRMCRARRGRGRTSRTPSTPRSATSPGRCATSPR